MCTFSSVYFSTYLHPKLKNLDTFRDLAHLLYTIQRNVEHTESALDYVDKQLQEGNGNHARIEAALRIYLLRLNEGQAMSLADILRTLAYYAEFKLDEYYSDTYLDELRPVIETLKHQMDLACATMTASQNFIVLKPRLKSILKTTNWVVTQVEAIMRDEFRAHKLGKRDDTSDDSD